MIEFVEDDVERRVYNAEIIEENGEEEVGGGGGIYVGGFEDEEIVRRFVRS